MGHELTEVEGGHAFVYNVERGYPWHRLGIPVPGFMDPDEALELAKCNDSIALEETKVPGLFYTHSDIHGYMGVVGSEWRPQTCEEMVDLALSIVGMTEDTAVIDTMGRLGPQAQRFFCHIEFPELVVDPNGVADKIRRGLFVGTSFDGSMANILGLSNIREVCANTVRMSLERLQQAIKVKHTTNAAERMQLAAEAVGYAAAAERAVVAKAEELLAVDGGPAMRAALDALWPIPDDLDPKWAARRDDIRDDVWDLYKGPSNCGSVGENGWAAYNACTEWLDHFRGVRLKDKSQDAIATRRMEQTLIDPLSDVNKQKYRAADAILALA
jgi:phage/plasmid-like protein (TIGR03299 family)